jgi:Tfp pilus assembly protein FimT
MKLNKFLDKNGFTMIDLVVGLFIIALITGLSYANFHSSSQRSRTLLAAQAVLSDFKLAENYTLGLQAYKGQPPIGGWGLRFDIATPTQYMIFADADDNKALSINEAFRTIVFPKNISISAISTTSPVDIVFAPPDPKIYIKASSTASSTISISDGGNTKKIYINFLGLADVIQ